MIPKIIHCCWLGTEEPHATAKKCIASWAEKLPGFEVKCWNEETFDVASVPYVRDAIENKKWAYACDYIRLHALYNEGGIYLDCDVEALGDISAWLDQNFFAGIEFQDGDRSKVLISPAVIGAEKENRIIKAALDSFTGKEFYNSDGTINTIPLSRTLTPSLTGMGFVRKDKEQNFPDVGITIYPTSVIGNPYVKNASTMKLYHHCVKSWAPKSFWQKVFKK